MRTAEELVKITFKAKWARWEQVLLLWFLGYSYREIAAAMGISKNTIRGHMRRACERWGADNYRELFADAYEKYPTLGIEK